MFLQERRLLIRVLRVVLDDESGGIELLLALNFCLLVHISEPFILLLDASELNPTRISPF